MVTLLSLVLMLIYLILLWQETTRQKREGVDADLRVLMTASDGSMLEQASREVSPLREKALPAP